MAVTRLVDAFGPGGSRLFRTLAVALALLVGFLVFVAFAMMKVSRTQDTCYGALKQVVDARMGRNADYHGLLNSGWSFFAYVPERCFYFHNAAAPFDPKHLYGAGDVRACEVEWTNKVRHGARESETYKDDICLVVEMHSPENPLLRFHCETEAMAYQLQAIFGEMFGAA